MKFNKKLFKSEMAMAFVASELSNDCADELDALEADPTFAIFINAIYRDVMKNSHKLLDDEDVWDPKIVELLKNVGDSLESDV